jgi:small-conductance mechanosensitive channel
VDNLAWSSIWRIGAALLVGVGSVLILNTGLSLFEKHHQKINSSEEYSRRLKTLARVGRGIGYVLIVLIVLLMILRELGIDITPILASAGVVGLALSLGAQTVIKDFLGGVLILVENQFAIGDVITVGQLTGTVERLTLRLTYLRDVEGKLNLIPNGDIRILSNLTTQWSQTVVTFNLDYETDMGAALKVLEEAARLVKADSDIAPALTEAPHALGWTGFNDWAVQMQIIAKTQPGKQWLVARALRKTALELLQKEDIRLAIPRQRTENIT